MPAASDESGSRPPELELVYHYHERTKHHLERYARSRGRMDWANEPDPFRRYTGAELFSLDRPAPCAHPTHDSLYTAGTVSSREVEHTSISELFYYSLALSAWKRAGQSRPWSLRVNPSSGDLHPTEAYLISGPIAGQCDEPALYHYTAYLHALERRGAIPVQAWTRIEQQAPAVRVLLGLTSITWREAWKYGERAFRYCQHDAGHAIGALTLSAACLGWHARLIETISDQELAGLLGIDRQEGSEAERPICLLMLTAQDGDPQMPQRDVLIDLKPAALQGHPNSLSEQHHDWPVIAEVARRTLREIHDPARETVHAESSVSVKEAILPDRGLSAHSIIRQRRSCLALDGRTPITREAFYHMMARTMPAGHNVYFKTMPYPVYVSLALFVHRVEGLDRGLYILVRHPHHVASLRETLRPEFTWLVPEGCPPALPLFLLKRADYRQTAGVVSCHQGIASDGAYALGMLARFDAGLDAYGPWFYPRLFWETGLIGQVLYLEAEAAGIRSTGIGCYFDDALHEVLGIKDHTWQSLYHFTVGAPVDDPRLQTIDAYAHLK